MWDRSRAHPITNAIEGTGRWWQSPPLSRMVEHNEVNITLDLGQVSPLSNRFRAVFGFSQTTLCGKFRWSCTRCGFVLLVIYWFRDFCDIALCDSIVS